MPRNDSEAGVAEDGSRAEGRRDSREHGGCIDDIPRSICGRRDYSRGVFGLGDECDAVGDARGDVSLKDDVGRVRQGDALRVGAVDEELLR